VLNSVRALRPAPLRPPPPPRLRECASSVEVRRGTHRCRVDPTGSGESTSHLLRLRQRPDRSCRLRGSVHGTAVGFAAVAAGRQATDHAGGPFGKVRVQAAAVRDAQRRRGAGRGVPTPPARPSPQRTCFPTLRCVCQQPRVRRCRPMCRVAGWRQRLYYRPAHSPADIDKAFPRPGVPGA
jgi:hypothetical protein